MPYAMLPRGYRAVFLGSAGNIEALGTFTPLEEGAAEGALVLMRLDFAEYPSSETLAQLNQACLDAGIPAWPGCEYIVFDDADKPTVYIAWQKGMAWLPILLGLLATMVLPPLLLGGIWLILPQEIKSLISSMINLGMMALVMFLLVKMLPALMPSKEKPKQIKERAE